MTARQWIALGISLFIAIIIAWVVLGVAAGWPWLIIAVSTLPLLITLLSMKGLATKPFFYAALILMLYIAFAISQMLVSVETRWQAGLVLALSLAYLAGLKWVLRAINAFRLRHHQESP